VFFWLIATVITSERRLRAFLWLLVLASLPLSITALQNYASGSFLRTPDGALPRIAGYTTAGSGLATNPNDLALMINLLIPFAVALMLMSRRLLPRLVAATALLLGVAGVVVTFSRAGFLTLAAMGLVGLLALGRRRPLALLASVGVLVLAASMLPQGYFERLSTITDIESDTTGSAQGRWNDALVAMEVAVRNPITGVGLDQNVLALNQERGATWREVHNVYLQYAVDLGVPGLVLFLALFVSLFRTAGRVRQAGRGRRGCRDVAVAAGSVQIALVAFAVAAFFHPVAYQFYFFLAAGLALAVHNVQRAGGSAPSRQAA
jgi:O-antigen ligase